MDIIGVAKTCHEANKALCEGIGDFTQKHWREAEKWQRDSAVNGVKFFIKNPKVPDSTQHEAWCNDKYAEGWVYGKEKDATKKTHPCLVSYMNLPIEQQAKDALFKAICKTLVPLIK